MVAMRSLTSRQHRGGSYHTLRFLPVWLGLAAFAMFVLQWSSTDDIISGVELPSEGRLELLETLKERTDKAVRQRKVPPPKRLLDQAKKGNAVVSNNNINDNNNDNAVDVWKNDYDIVHVIVSRFMQHQPDLLVLGRARLELFKTFCFKTIQQQTAQQFLWIIRTDPNLHPELKEGLLKIVDGYPNLVIVGSNEIRKGSHNGGFRGEEAITDITEESVVYGSRKRVLSFHEAAQTRVVLEVNLDADDGLGLTFIEKTEQATIPMFKKTEKEQNGWFNWCVNNHIEWQYYAPWDNQTDTGSLKKGSAHICVTPGLTWATQPKAKPDFILGHHAIKRRTEECAISKRDDYGCWKHIETELNMAIRARTPTSTGMNRVTLDGERWNIQERGRDKEFWAGKLENELGITPAEVKETRLYLKNHLSEIVLENLKGQCTKDHSCSEGIKNKLRQAIGEPTVAITTKPKKNN